MQDLTLDRTYARGSRGKRVRLLQEWLSLQGFGVVPDGEFGPATEDALKKFQTKKALPATGVADTATFDLLVAPMRAVLRPIAPKSSLGLTVVAYAQQHLKAHPCEVGGQNRGPWVRLYMDGNEGEQFAWCAGFVCFVLRQACDALGAPLPLTPSVSCDSLAASAKQRGMFLPETDAAPGEIPRGSFFLNRRTPTDWTHVGIVTATAAESVSTIEGNTNDEGSREGFEVCARTRGYPGKDFIVIA